MTKTDFNRLSEIVSFGTSVLNLSTKLHYYYLFVILNFGHCYLFVIWDLLFVIFKLPDYGTEP